MRKFEHLDELYHAGPWRQNDTMLSKKYKNIGKAVSPKQNKFDKSQVVKYYSLRGDGVSFSDILTLVKYKALSNRKEDIITLNNLVQQDQGLFTKSEYRQLVNIISDALKRVGL